MLLRNQRGHLSNYPECLGKFIDSLRLNSFSEAWEAIISHSVDSIHCVFFSLRSFAQDIWRWLGYVNEFAVRNMLKNTVPEIYNLNASSNTADLLKTGFDIIEPMVLKIS